MDASTYTGLGGSIGEIAKNQAQVYRYLDTDEFRLLKHEETVALPD